MDLAKSIPGSPIVGFFNEASGDFEEHNRVIDISNGKFEIKDTTRPYGFVDLGAPVWFEWFQDDGIPHEYLMTEGYLWTGQYPECQRVIDKGNNQSMELDEKTLKANWASLDNSDQEFFIINEAIMSKLCILGEDIEPCFEGSQITKVQFSFDEGFQTQLFSMMNQMKQILKEEGGTPVFTRYNVQVGDSLWTSLYNFIGENYSISEICEEDGQVFAILQNNQDNKYYHLNIQMNDTEFSAEEYVEMTDYTAPAEAQFSLEDVEAFKKKKDEEKDPEQKEDKGSEDKKDPEPPADDEDKDEDEKKKKKKYNLDEIEEYISLKASYDELESKFAALQAERDNFETENKKLVEFKNSIDREKKQEMIDSFYMLSDDDKSDVIKNIDTYSLDDIEAKLSVICVRNKVSFSLDEDEPDEKKKGMTYSLDGLDEDNSVPAWVKAVQQTQKSMSM